MRAPPASAGIAGGSYATDFRHTPFVVFCLKKIITITYHHDLMTSLLSWLWLVGFRYIMHIT